MFNQFQKQKQKRCCLIFKCQLGEQKHACECTQHKSSTCKATVHPRQKQWWTCLFLLSFINVTKPQVLIKIHEPTPPRPDTRNQKWSEAAVPDRFLFPPSLNISYCQSGPHPTLMIGKAAEGSHTHTHTRTNSHGPCSQTHTHRLNYYAVN